MNRIAIVASMALLASCASSPTGLSVETVSEIVARSTDLVACGKDGKVQTVKGAFVRDQMVCDRHLIPSAFDVAYGARCYPITDLQWLEASVEASQRVCQATT